MRDRSIIFKKTNHRFFCPVVRDIKFKFLLTCFPCF